MANVKTNKSVEPQVADLANGWLKAYGLNYKLEQEELNQEIDKALADYYSKTGGAAATARMPNLSPKIREHLNTSPFLLNTRGTKTSS